MRLFIFNNLTWGLIDPPDSSSEEVVAGLPAILSGIFFNRQHSFLIIHCIIISQF